MPTIARFSILIQNKPWAAGAVIAAWCIHTALGAVTCVVHNKCVDIGRGRRRCCGRHCKNKYNYSQLHLNGHLVKADISLKWTHGVGPCSTSVIYFISLQGRHLSKADSRSSGPEHVYLRGSWLYYNREGVTWKRMSMSLQQMQQNDWNSKF